jgi:hypothetical protein
MLEQLGVDSRIRDHFNISRTGEKFEFKRILSDGYSAPPTLYDLTVALRRIAFRHSLEHDSYVLGASATEMSNLVAHFRFPKEPLRKK